MRQDRTFLIAYCLIHVIVIFFMMFFFVIFRPPAWETFSLATRIAVGIPFYVFAVPPLMALNAVGATPLGAPGGIAAGMAVIYLYGRLALVLYRRLRGREGRNSK